MFENNLPSLSNHLLLDIMCGRFGIFPFIYAVLCSISIGFITVAIPKFIAHQKKEKMTRFLFINGLLFYVFTILAIIGIGILPFRLCYSDSIPRAVTYYILYIGFGLHMISMLTLLF